MNDKRYGILALILAVVALAVSTLAYLLPFLVKLGLIAAEENLFIWQIWVGPVNLYLWGWVLGLGLAVASLVLVRRSPKQLVKALVWIVSSLSIIATLFWAIPALYLFINFLRYGFPQK
jgi:hypothetical protein